MRKEKYVHGLRSEVKLRTFPERRERRYDWQHPVIERHRLAPVADDVGRRGPVDFAVAGRSPV